MGLHDRPYWKDGGGGRPMMRLSIPRPRRVVFVLMGINIAVLFLTVFPQVEAWIVRWFALPASDWWQLWRYVTFQFIHVDFWHLFFNMLGLYVLGTELEAHWGPRRFLGFYLLCGVAGGIAHVLATFLLSKYTESPLMGASGGVFGVLLACAVYFPGIQVIFFLFPIPIRVAAAILLGLGCYYILRDVGAVMAGRHLMPGGVSDPAHLGGALAAAVWIWILPRVLRRVSMGKDRMGKDRMGRGRWEKKRHAERARQEEIDEILDKIRQGGIGSLSRSEKRKLQEETQRQHRDGE